MDIAQTFLLICWATFLLYWIVNWWNVKPTQEKPSSGVYRAIPLGFVALVLLNHFVLHDAVHLPSCQWSWLGCDVPASSFGTSPPVSIQIASVVLAAFGLGVALVARTTLAGNWSSTLDVKKDHELVTTGIYHYVRHPIYSGMLLLVLAMVLGFQAPGGLFLVLLAAAIFLLRIKREEALMTKTFPSEYPAYKKRTKALIPFIW